MKWEQHVKTTFKEYFFKGEQRSSAVSGGRFESREGFTVVVGRY